jgi:hypothetical protein
LWKTAANRAVVTALGACSLNDYSKWMLTRDISFPNGELNQNNWEQKSEGHVLLSNAVLLDNLRCDLKLFEEVATIAAKDGRLGLLIELTVECKESEPPDVTNYDGLPFRADVVRLILKKGPALVARFSGIEVCVPSASEVFNGRAAMWVFVPRGTLHLQELLQLRDALSDLSSWLIAPWPFASPADYGRRRKLLPQQRNQKG